MLRRLLFSDVDVSEVIIWFRRHHRCASCPCAAKFLTDEVLLGETVYIGLPNSRGVDSDTVCFLSLLLLLLEVDVDAWRVL